MQKVIRHVYLCDGHPSCYGNPECGLCHAKGSCTHTTDISYAQNRKAIINDPNYPDQHMIKVADSDWEELYFEE